MPVVVLLGIAAAGFGLYQVKAVVVAVTEVAAPVAEGVKNLTQGPAGMLLGIALAAFVLVVYVWPKLKGGYSSA